MRVDLFDFELPEDRIALRPAEPRDSAKLLLVQPGQPFEDRFVRDLPDLLRPGDVLVVNDTKVIPSRLYGLRVREDTAARVEIMLHKREGADRWRAFARPAKKLNPGDRIRFGEASESTACELVRLDAEVAEKGEGGEVLLGFSMTGAYLDEAIARLGELPLPPTSRGSARRTSATARTTRRFTPGRRARSQPPPPACTSRPSCSSASMRAAFGARSSPSTSAPAPSCQ
jgi:S-adenosylmethionine:tRNA ribosyltransferase-isomerase